MHIISLATHISESVDKPLSVRKISCFRRQAVENRFFFILQALSKFIDSYGAMVVRNFTKFQIRFR